MAARRGWSLAGLAGIAVALLLVLALNAIFAGMQQRLTAYIERSGADVIVAQRGVETMHMTESALPEPEVAAIRAVPGVAEARPILYVPTLIERGDDRAIVYLIGDDEGGAPVAVTRGRRPVGGEVLLDGVAARDLKVSPGGTVRVLGQDFRVSGEVEGLASITNSVAFVPRGDLSRMLGLKGVVSYVFVRARRESSSGRQLHGSSRYRRRRPAVSKAVGDRLVMRIFPDLSKVSPVDNHRRPGPKAKVPGPIGEVR